MTNIGKTKKKEFASRYSFIIQLLPSLFNIFEVASRYSFITITVKKEEKKGTIVHPSTSLEKLTI